MSVSEIRERLSALARKDMVGDCVRALDDLKRSGFEPSVVYDIGACVGQWTKLSRTFWPDATYVLFDAYEPAAFLYGDHERFVGVLGARDNDVVRFYQSDVHVTGNSRYNERNDDAFPESGHVLRSTRSLDSVVRGYGFPKPDLVKIDVHGSEADVLAGATETLASAKALVVEMQSVRYNRGAPLVGETKPKIEEGGWNLFGVYDDNGIDADYVFVRDALESSIGS